MNVEEIESAVSGLSANELARFSEWFEEFVADQWDHQIERDLLAGRLDSALKRADEHHEAGVLYSARVGLHSRALARHSIQ